MQIDRNIAVPENRARYPFADMEEGDSILFESQRRALSARVAAVRFCQRYHPQWTFSVRKVQNGWRLWRIK